MTNHPPRRAGPVWLWALVLLVILIALFVLLRRDAAAQDTGGDRRSVIGAEQVASLVVAPDPAGVDVIGRNPLIYKTFNAHFGDRIGAGTAPTEGHEPLE